MSQKIGFWAVFALVAGSQIGSGVFMQPASLAPFGLYSLLGWLISGTGAIALALVFSWLCSRLPKTGGPCVYVEEAFGPTFGFFTGWTYWVISWVSTTVLFVASIGYLSPLFGHPSAFTRLMMELGLLFLLTWINLRGVVAAGRAEFVLSLLKVIPLVLMPAVSLFFFDSSNFFVDKSKMADSSLSGILSSVALLTLWGFIGLETATTAAGSVENAKKTIPRAIFLGTTCVAILYFFNSLAIMGLMPGAELMSSKAPYADAAQHIFGGSWHLAVSAIAAIVCIGTANAWTLSAGQASLGLAEDGLLPRLFAKRNARGAPVVGLIASCIGVVPILVLTANENLVAQINMIIDFSVTAFLFVYLACVFAFFRIMFKKGELAIGYMLAGLVGGGFCLWVLFETPWHILAIASLFGLSGLPVFCYNAKFRPQNIIAR
ncbi:MAG TPA: amino acid permease [Myxococcota bacterium]|nr:amino acid permease [Myxococcota bacterium]